ncbi:MAG: hypothetical protein IPL16_11605 [Ignavibacteria bacterium]|nr:hypothetical protein [Ignavibacteria bacterium]
MESFKIRTKIKNNHKLEIENLPFENGQEVEVIITLEAKDSINDIMKFEESSGALDFLNDAREDIYTVNDLKVKYK